MKRSKCEQEGNLKENENYEIKQDVSALQPIRTLDSQPETTSYLRPGMRYSGFQFSGSNQYKVEITLSDVDLSKCSISGSLTIYGLTELHPEISTFFSGEMIGPMYSFKTKNELWGSTWNNDIQHWARFDSWRKLNINVNQPDNHPYYENALNYQHLYFRWKELFLCDNPHVTDIRGASFAGFYYICFSQIDGSIHGMYYHRHSDKFQRLTLQPIESINYSSFEYV